MYLSNWWSDLRDINQIGPNTRGFPLVQQLHSGIASTLEEQLGDTVNLHPYVISAICGNIYKLSLSRDITFIIFYSDTSSPTFQCTMTLQLYSSTIHVNGCTVNIDVSIFNYMCTDAPEQCLNVNNLNVVKIRNDSMPEVSCTQEPD